MAADPARADEAIVSASTVHVVLLQEIIPSIERKSSEFVNYLRPSGAERGHDRIQLSSRRLQPIGEKLMLESGFTVSFCQLEGTQTGAAGGGGEKRASAAAAESSS